MISFINITLSVLVVLGQVAVVVTLVALFLKKRGTPLVNFIRKHGLWIAFVTALIATLGSLFYSEIAGYEPCKLCWFQRILMYPQVILIGMALWKKDSLVFRYILVLSGLGILIAGYHYLLQLGLMPSIACGTVGYSVSCSQRFVMEWGYITIPLMAFTAFLMSYLTSLISLKK